MDRREFLQSSLAASLTWAGSTAQAHSERVVRRVRIVLLGGPSQLDTWDPKPMAPEEIRGPFASISTSVPGLRYSELFPQLAARARHLCTVRSVHHTEAPIHEIGLQLLHCGTIGEPYHPGADRFTLPGQPNLLLPKPIGFTGVNLDRGQSFHQVVSRMPMVSARDHERYGYSHFGDDCRRIVDLLEQGATSITVNMFTEVYDQLSWDCHAAGGSLNTQLTDYRIIGPMFDTAFASLLDDLRDRGLLAETQLVAAGEFGRTPRINRQGGRDHWTRAWSILLAGAGTPSEAVIGSTDGHGAEIVDRPIDLRQIPEIVLEYPGEAVWSSGCGSAFPCRPGPCRRPFLP